jgi:ferric-dicitrate binding protein FerR (iron transport regulator)
MRGGGARAVVASSCLLAILACGCSGCRKGDALAELDKKAGKIDRDSAGTVGTWKTAEIHAKFFVGDGVRSGPVSTASLALSDGSELELEENTLIRFLDRPPGSHEAHLDLEMGEAVVQTGGDGLTLRTEVGVAVVDPGTRFSLKKSDAGVRYQVSVGLAHFESHGEKVDLKAGQGVAIGIGEAKLEPFDTQKTAPTPTTSAAPPAAPQDAGASPPPAESGTVSAHVVGAAASIRAPGASAFEKLAAGDRTFASGSTLRLGAGTTADVKVGDQRAVLRGAGEFVVAQAGRPFVQAGGGSVSLVNTGTEVEVAVPGGSIIAKLGTSADVHVRSDETRVAVKTGSAELRGPNGTATLGAGEEGTLAARGATEVAGRGPGYVDFVVAAGGSFAVHDPKPPTAIGFVVGNTCPGDAVVELKGRPKDRSRGSGTVSLLVPPGSHRYEVRCVGPNGIEPGSKASGSVTVMHDAGTARLPRTAPATSVDTDGRSYTVLYQNLLPKIFVRWPKAPEAPGYTLTVSSSGGKTETFSGASASRSFASGELREGTHHFAFEARGGQRSKDTTVDIRFDNATPTATLTSPADGSFAPGAQVVVAGVAMEGWKISAGGRELPLDGQLRFSGEVAAPAGQRALAIEFVHPRRGVHYYLRRSAGH